MVSVGTVVWAGAVVSVGLVLLEGVVSSVVSSVVSIEELSCVLGSVEAGFFLQPFKLNKSPVRTHIISSDRTKAFNFDVVIVLPHTHCGHIKIPVGDFLQYSRYMKKCPP